MTTKTIFTLAVFLTLLSTAFKIPAAVKRKTAPQLSESTPVFLGRGINIPSIEQMNAAHYTIIRKAGFDHVRIPIHPFSQTNGTEDYTLKSSFFDAIDTAINRSLVNNLIPIIDFHEHSAMQKDPSGTKPMFLAIWKQLAIHYQGFPGSVLFEIANEPNMKADLWNEILSEAHAIIRKSNPNRTLLIGTVYGNQIKYLKDLKIPENDKNIIVTVHYYMPINFTHQGAQWSNNYKNISGLSWPTDQSGEQEIINDFKVAAEWSKTYGIPIHLGEFGTYNKSPMDSRVRWTKTVARLAEQLHWSWCYWELNQGFGIYSLTTNKWNDLLFHALIP